MGSLGNQWGWQQWLLYGGLLAAALQDLSWRRIPNWFSLPFLAVGLVVQGLTGGGRGLLVGLLGAAVGLLLILLPFSLRLLRGGDVKLLAAMGAWLGPLPVLVATLVGAVLAGVLVAGLLVGRPALRREVVANLRGLVLGLGLPRPPVRPPHLAVPLGTALAAGGVLTHLFGWGS